MRFLLQQEMPFSRGLKQEIVYICSSGLIALLLFFLIRPFGFNNLSDLSLFGYGLVSIAMAILYMAITHWLYNRYWTNNNWTTGLEILRSLFFLLFIAMGILVYGSIVHVSSLSFKNVFVYLSYTIILGIIPVIIRTILVRNWRLKKELIEVKKINELLNNRAKSLREKLIELPTSKNECIKLTNQELLYLESVENYITVYWNVGNETRKSMIRMTMKEAIKLIDDPFIVFCHRSFIVNLRKVKEVVVQSGSSSIILSELDKSIPLSATYKTQLKQKLKEL